MAIKQIPGLRGPDKPTKFAVSKGPFQDPARNYTLTCDVGAYVYTGIAASVGVARKLPCATGAYAYAGLTATVGVARKLPCATGAYSYSGLAATLTVQRRLSAATGSYAIAGQAATLGVARKLALATGAYVYTGQAATLTYVANVPAAPPLVFPYFPDVEVMAKQRKRKPVDLRLLLIG